jgi:hypothetical protein
MVFKVLRFLDAEQPWLDGLESRWELALASGPPTGAPSRVTVATPLRLPGLAPAPFAAIDVQWFEVVDDAIGNDAWLAAADPGLGVGSAALGARSCRVIAEEVVVRGPDYLQERWRDGGRRYKMTSFGKRNPELSLAQFSARWRSHAGQLGSEEIPVDVRGLAYVQNHAIPGDGREWPFDAVNEVYFDRLDDLERRRAYFAARQDAAARSGAESFLSPTGRWSMYVSETPVPAAASAAASSGITAFQSPTIPTSQ